MVTGDDEKNLCVVIPGLGLSEIFIHQLCGQRPPHRESWACKPVKVADHMGQQRDAVSHRMPKGPPTADETMLSRGFA